MMQRASRASRGGSRRFRGPLIEPYDYLHWWRVFRFIHRDVEVLGYLDYHREKVSTMMKNPPLPGEFLGEDVVAELNLTVAETPARRGVFQVTLSRALHGHAAISPNLSIRLERAGIGTARAWLAMQTNYDLARELGGKSHDVEPLVAR